MNILNSSSRRQRRFIKVNVFIFCAAILLASPLSAFSADQPRILVYTRNQVGKGLFVHDNIPDSIVALKKLGAENAFAVDVSADPATFVTTNLQRFKAIVFDNSNNEIFDNEEQKTALQHFVEAGGGIVGIHSCSGSMRHWPWFWSMMGGKFLRHAKLQTFTVHVKDSSHPATAPFPPTFQWTDEFYFLTNMPGDLHILLAGDLATLNDPDKDKSKNPKYGDEVPLCWCHEFDGGREWYTALGHQKAHYADPVFAKHLLGGILWAMGETNVKH
jgi:type 1 glutamine amidotransferase